MNESIKNIRFFISACVISIGFYIGGKHTMDFFAEMLKKELDIIKNKEDL